MELVYDSDMGVYRLPENEEEAKKAKYVPIPDISPVTVERIIRHFFNLQKVLMNAS